SVDMKRLEGMGCGVGWLEWGDGIAGDRPHGQRIYFDSPSHTGTENVLLAATLAEGSTVLKHASVEPEVADLASCLQQMGARVRGIGTRYVEVEGVDRLHGVEYRVMPDRIEAGTFAIAGAITPGDVVVDDIVPDHMDPLSHKLEEVGASVQIDGPCYRVRANGEFRPVEVQTLHFPGFPTDLQAAFATLLTQARGTSLVHERVFDDRLQYAGELQKLGADIRVSG